MEKGVVWSEHETLQLCLAWLAISEDPIRGAGQKKATFFERVYQQWLENVGANAEPRSEKAIAGRWKKMQPEVTKFEGIYMKLQSQERSDWSEQTYIENTAKIYQERTKQPFEYLAAWKELRNKPKWSSKTTTSLQAGKKRKAAVDGSLARPGGRKAAKEKAQSDTRLPVDVHLRFVKASEKKADILEQQLHYSLFMQAPDSEESKENFALRRKAILAKLRAAGSKAMVAVNTGLLEHVENHDATNHVGEDTNEQLSCNHLYNATQTSAAKGNNPNASFVLDAAALT